MGRGDVGQRPVPDLAGGVPQSERHEAGQPERAADLLHRALDA